MTAIAVGARTPRSINRAGVDRSMRRVGALTFRTRATPTS
jgi:hypothetical protein